MGKECLVIKRSCMCQRSQLRTAPLIAQEHLFSGHRNVRRSQIVMEKTHRIANVTVPQLAMKNAIFALAVKNLPVPVPVLGNFPALRRRSEDSQRPVSCSSFSGYRAPSTLIFDAALSISRRSSDVSSIEAAPIFSSSQIGRASCRERLY